MESDFIEISGEDDSLLPLPKFPNDDVSSLGKSFFSCSPLHLPRSDCSIKPPLPSQTAAAKLIAREDEKKMDLSSNGVGVNKENVDVPKLSMEPHQMKRKKKGGGYNLRKSLAWNRAFFTEEGVLNPLELSVISGDFSKPSGEMSVIDEDVGDLLSGDSENLVALEENKFKELPSSAIKEERKSSGPLLPKNCPSSGVSAASAFAAKRKVHSANDSNISGSKRSGCPRTVSSASLKRPVNLNTSMEANKELKVPKLRLPKQDGSVISAAAKTKVLCASNSKQNHIAQQAINTQRNIRLKGSVNSSKSAQNSDKSCFAGKSMAAKSSVRPARRNVVSSVPKIQSSTNSQHPLVTKANNRLKNIPAPELPAPQHASGSVYGTSKKINSIPQTAPPSARSMQNAHPPMAKPSGLRMPSPSLSFFNQSKASPSNSLSQRSSPICNLESNIPSFRKFGALNTINKIPIPAPQRIADVVLRPPGSITGPSVPSSVKLDSHEKMKSDLQNSNVQNVCMDETSNSSDILNHQILQNLCNDFEERSGQHAEPSKNEKISHVGGTELQSNDNKLLLQNAPGDHVMEAGDNERVANVYPLYTNLSGAELENPDCTSHLCPTMQVDALSETRDMIYNKCIEEKMCDSSIKSNGVFAESLFVNSCVPDVNEQSKEQAEKKKPFTFQEGQLSNESQGLLIHNDTLSKESGSLLQFQKCNNVLNADASPEVKCCIIELESSHGLIQSKNTKKAKDCVAGVDILSTKSLVGDGELQSVGGTISVGSGNKILCSPSLHNQSITVVDDAREVIIDDKSEVIIDDGGSKSKGSSGTPSISPAIEDCSFHVARTAGCLHGDDALLGSIDTQFSYDMKLHGQTTTAESEMMTEDQITAAVTTGSVDAQFSYDTKLHGQITTEESEMMTEDQITAAVTTGDIQISNVPDSGDFSVYEEFDKNLQHLTSIHSAVVQPESNNVIAAVQVNSSSDFHEHKDMEEKSRKFDMGNITDISPDVKNLSGRGSESCHVLFQHEHTEQNNEETTGVDNRATKSLLEDAHIKALDGNLSFDSCNYNLSATALKNTSPVCTDGVHEQSLVCNNPDPVTAQVSLDSHAFCLNEKLTINNFPSEKFQGRNICGSVMDVESRSSIVLTHIKPLKNGGILEEQELDYPFPSEMSCSFDIKPSTENPKFDANTKFRHGDDDHAYSVGFDVSLEMSNGKISREAKSCNSEENQTLSCISNLEANILKSEGLPEEVKRSSGRPYCKMQPELEDGMHATEDKDGSVLQDSKLNDYKSDVLPEEAELTAFQKIGGPHSNMKHDSEYTICAADDNDETKLLKNSLSDKKNNDVVIKPPPHAVPFSDEWLAAYESAGEEFLTKKSGAVQHSPPEKSLPEPGPWSPVRRKNNQEIGPYDCTKYTNAGSN